MKIIKLIIFTMLSTILIMTKVQAVTEQVSVDSITLDLGEARTIHFQSPFATVFISDPEKADYQVVNNQTLVVYARKTGQANIIVYEDSGDIMYQRQLVIDDGGRELHQDLANKLLIQDKEKDITRKSFIKNYSRVQEEMSIRYPGRNIRISGLGEKSMISALVYNDAEKQEIYELAGYLLGYESEEKTKDWDVEEGSENEVDYLATIKFSNLLNQIEVASTKQINVKVSIAEVSHSFMDQFGIQFGDAGQTAGVFVNPIKSFSSSDILSVITALNDESVGQILAEPNLSVISGESANFLVGGEIPVTTVIDGATNVDYKEFGIRLEVIAKVQKNDKIKLSLMPEVSALDQIYSDSSGNTSPSFRTRKARTTVELNDGQSFVLGGLLSTQDKEDLSKIPYIADIPILGSLFRNTSTERTKSELIIVATVNLVNPIEAEQVILPTMYKTTTLHRFFAWPRQAVNKPSHADHILATGGFIQ